MIVPFGSVQRHLTGVMAPGGFHGAGKQASYFEGWYLKFVTADESDQVALIPGLFLGKDGRGEAFVQVLDGTTATSSYHRFDPDQFVASPSEFDTAIADNRFDQSGITVDLPSVAGSIRYTEPLTPWPVEMWSPGIMGWFAWLPSLQCYHGLLSFDHGLAGSLEVGGRTIDFTDGRGYIEKDWGRSFPTGYVWMQSNHFTTTRLSVSASTALVPVLGRTLRGFIVGVWLDGTLYRFATHNGSRSRTLNVTDESVRWELSDPLGRRLILNAKRHPGTMLMAPLPSGMEPVVEESLEATIYVRLTDRDGSVLVEDVGRCAGLEVYGDIQALAGAH